MFIMKILNTLDSLTAIKKRILSATLHVSGEDARVGCTISFGGKITQNFSFEEIALSCPLWVRAWYGVSFSVKIGFIKLRLRFL